MIIERKQQSTFELTTRRMRHAGRTISIDVTVSKCTDDLSLRRVCKRDLHAPRRDGDQLGGDVIGEDHEHGAGRWFFDDLEQRRPGACHQVKVAQDQHFADAFDG